MHDTEQEAAQGTLGGGWLGTYAYKGGRQSQPPVRFEATLTETGDGGFAGAILDDGQFGEAQVRGERSGQGIRFSKLYSGVKLPPVSYEGTLSEDGQTMAGTWQINRTDHGVWDARRAWSDHGLAAEDETAEDAAKEASEGWDKPRVREVVRLG